MNRILLAALVTGATTAACNEGEEAPGGSALSGTWTLPEGTWLRDVNYWSDGLVHQETLGSPLCNVEMTGSRGSAHCEFSLTGDYGKEDPVTITFKLDAAISVSETKVTTEGTWSATSRASFDGDNYVSECSIAFSGSASRNSGRESDGRFSALAGKWEGTAQTSGQCSDSRNYDQNLDSAWQFEADLFAEQGTVTVRQLGSQYDDIWVFQNSQEGLKVRMFGSETAVFADEVE